MEHKKKDRYSDMSDLFYNEFEEEDIAIKPYELDYASNDFNVSSLLSFISRGYLKIPSFQRNYIWKKDMASKFIESIILGLPIPQVFWFEKSRNNFLVIDGQQRIITLYLFKKQRFPKNDKGRAIIRRYLSNGNEIPDREIGGDNFEDFKLKLPATTPDDDNPLNNRKYDTLPPISDINSYDFKGEFDFLSSIRTIIIKQIAPSGDYSSMFEIFSRLNSGGVTLKAQEIRMSMFYSIFYDKLIDELNLNGKWRKFLGKSEPDIHMSDVEVLVRAFALLELGDNYQAPMHGFLNSFSEHAKSYDKEKINELHAIFNDFWSSCELLKSDAFKNEKKKFYISLFDAVFVTVCKIIKKEGLKGRKIQPESIEHLVKNPVFSMASQGNTASVGHVATRLSEASKTVVLL
ncbi:MAG: DUF262 domain-containing protein [Eubacterium sp.]|jgi:uncharacterized protein with ParB-like and HNH nuclease domain|nr:DUF262 domain-containing protein [Eubacterium sp.]